MKRSSFCGTAELHPGRLWVQVVLMWSISWAALSQGTIKVYDQVINYGMPDLYDGHSDFPPVRTNAPFAQSFEPTLDKVGFVEIAFLYGLSSDSLRSETLCLNLREGSATGPILGSTSPVLFLRGESSDRRACPKPDGVLRRAGAAAGSKSGF